MKFILNFLKRLASVLILFTTVALCVLLVAPWIVASVAWWILTGRDLIDATTKLVEGILDFAMDLSGIGS